MGGILSLPFDFHSRSDDGDENEKVHTVLLPVLSPRIGVQSEIMLSPSLDVVIRGEYVLASINLDNRWTYTDEDDASNSIPANWDPYGRPEPKIDYSGFQFSIGIRSVFIN